MTTKPAASTKKKLAAIAKAETDANKKEAALLRGFRSGRETTGNPLEDWLLVHFQRKPPERARKAMTDLCGRLKGKTGQYVLMVQKTTVYGERTGCFSGPSEIVNTFLTLGILRSDTPLLAVDPSNDLLPFGLLVTDWTMAEQGYTSHHGFSGHPMPTQATPDILRPDHLPFFCWLGLSDDLDNETRELFFLVGDEEVLAWPEHEGNPSRYAKRHSFSALCDLAKKLSRPLRETPALATHEEKRRQAYLEELTNAVKTRNESLREIEFPTKDGKAEPTTFVITVRKARDQIERLLPHAKDFDLADDPLVQAEAARYNIML